jgi:hypothetical protein
LGTAAYGQNNTLGSWNVLNLKYNLNSKWNIFGEAQLRSLKFYSDFHYYEYKAAVNYIAHSNAILTLGAGSYNTYQEGGNFVTPKAKDEFRLWPQVILTQNIGNLKIEQRYRAEFRFTNDGYLNRIRFRIGVAYPFGSETKGYKPFQVSASNEIFFTFKEPYFERNRMQFAFNYRASKAITLQTGYLHQFDYKINDESGNDFIVIGLFFELYRKNAGYEPNKTELKDN